MPVVSVVRDGEQHPIWAIRLARVAHQIAADSLRPQPPPADRVYQLWLLSTGRRNAKADRLVAPIGTQADRGDTGECASARRRGRARGHARTSRRLDRASTDRAHTVPGHPRRLRLSSRLACMKQLRCSSLEWCGAPCRNAKRAIPSYPRHPTRQKRRVRARRHVEDRSIGIGRGNLNLKARICCRVAAGVVSAPIPKQPLRATEVSLKLPPADLT